MTLIQIAILALTFVHPLAPKQHDARAIAIAAAQAVEADEEEPITGSKVGDVVLALATAWGESTLSNTRHGECVTGDGGKAFGVWQLQHAPAAVACHPAPAAREWLRRAHDSVRRCSGLPDDAKLAGLFSGNCGHGLAMSRYRIATARNIELALTEVVGDE